MYQCLVKSGFQDCKVGLTLAPTLRAGNPHTAVFDGKRIRKLEPLENVLLMGFEKEDYEKMKNAGVSNAQIYIVHQLGIWCLSTLRCPAALLWDPLPTLHTGLRFR